MIGTRLKEERERLGLSQPQFAELAGAAKRTLIDWEKGVSSPTAVQLSALAKAGVDAEYVLTGRHGPARLNTAVDGIPARLAELRRAKGDEAVYAASGAGAQVWDNIAAHGRAAMPRGLLQKLMDAFEDVPPLWLLAGEGPAPLWLGHGQQSGWDKPYPAQAQQTEYCAKENTAEADTLDARLLSAWRGCQQSERDAVLHLLERLVAARRPEGDEK